MTEEQKLQLWLDLCKFLRERRARMLAKKGEFAVVELTQNN